jgi:hypothetical protein
MSDVTEQFQALRLISDAGMLHEAQIEHLKYWPRLMIPHSVASEFTFDPEKHVVEFRLTTKGRAPRNLSVRFKALDAAVKWLLGEHYRIKVKVGDETLFSSRGKPSARE